MQAAAAECFYIQFVETHDEVTVVVMLQLCRALLCMWVFMKSHRHAPARALMFLFFSHIFERPGSGLRHSLGVMSLSRGHIYLRAPNASHYVGECLDRRLRLMWDFHPLPYSVTDGSVSRLCREKALVLQVAYIRLCAAWWGDALKLSNRQVFMLDC